MKRIITLVLTAGLLFGAASSASAVDFKAKGQWIFGFGMVDTAYMAKRNGNHFNNGDTFAALQRVRLQLEAVASEALSGTVYFEIGDTSWGQAGSGGALGADGTIVKVKRAYLDWLVPNTDLRFRMGLQGIALPNAAGGSAILDDDVAGIVATYTFNDAVSLTFIWARSYNDNYNNGVDSRTDPSGYLDNVDLFALALPITVDGWKVTPWVMLGTQGKNFSATQINMGASWANYVSGMNSITLAQRTLLGLSELDNARTPRIRDMGAYRNLFFAGLPVQYTGLDPWNFELDLNYGYTGNDMVYSTTDYKTGVVKRADNSRQGWLIKGLVEYKMDWGVPGLFAWYGSGDDGNVRNGSERMPALSPCGNFTSFMGDGDINGWSIHNSRWANTGYDQMLSYSGTWGVGVQIKDMSFVEGLKHTVRMAYWGGTNSPSMVKYLNADSVYRVGLNTRATEGFYLTTNDALVEFNVDSTYKIYENLTATLELGYIVNAVSSGTWNRSFSQNRFSKQDAYKAALVFNYSF